MVKRRHATVDEHGKHGPLASGRAADVEGVPCVAGEHEQAVAGGVDHEGTKAVVFVETENGMALGCGRGSPEVECVYGVEIAEEGDERERRWWARRKSSAEVRRHQERQTARQRRSVFAGRRTRISHTTSSSGRMAPVGAMAPHNPSAMIEEGSERSVAMARPAVGGSGF
jgi:hypothetical protein